MKKIALLAAVVFATLIAVLALWQLRNIVLLFVVSLAVSAMVRWPIEFLTSRRVPHGLAVAFVFLIGVGVVAAVIFLIAPQLAQQVPALTKELGDAYSRFYMSLIDGPSRTAQLAGQWLPKPSSLGILANPAATELPVDAAVEVTMSLFDVVAQSLLVIVLSVYWMSDRVSVERLWLSLLPPDRRARARDITRAIGASIGEYLRSEAAQTLLAGVLLYVLFSLIGAKYALVMAVVAALAWLIPIVGAVFAVMVVTLIALLSSPLIVALTVALTLAVFALLEFVVERKLYQRRRYGSLWAVVIALAMLDVFGILGLVLAPIAAAVVQIVIEELLRPAPVVAAAKVVPNMEALRTRLTEAQAELAQLDDPSPRTLGLMKRLSDLLNKTESSFVRQ
jgi:predicted PurR-regulated permease PerM